MTIEQYVQQVHDAKSFISQRLDCDPKIAIVLGTGLSGFESDLTQKIEIAYKDIPHFPLSTAPSHQGKLVIGNLKGKAVICLCGRFHYYEGYDMWTVTFPIRVLGELGIKHLLLTNASGGTNETFDAGDLVFIKDHINLFPDSPLRGQNHTQWGPRFPDMSKAYAGEYLAIGKRACHKLDIQFKTGVYVGFPGPSLETPAEYEFIYKAGGDMVGMSTVPEVLVARHMNIGVAGISIVTNACYPPSRVKETTVEEVIEMAHRKSNVFKKLVSEIILGIE